MQANSTLWEKCSQQKKDFGKPNIHNPPHTTRNATILRGQIFTTMQEWSINDAEEYKPTSITAKVLITSLNSHFPGICIGARCRWESRRVYREKKAPRHSVQNRGAYEIPTDRHLPPLWVVASLWGLRAKKPVLHSSQNRRCCSTLSIGKTTI